MTDGIGLNSPEIERRAAGASSVSPDITRAIAQRADIAERAGLPANAIRFLNADDEESLNAQAASLAGMLAGRAPRPRLVVRGEGTHPATQRSGSPLEDELRKALNLPSSW